MVGITGGKQKKTQKHTRVSARTRMDEELWREKAERIKESA